MHYDVIVIGAGAAGLMCAIEAGKRGRRVAGPRAQRRIGRKILISGGGRCNFTNLYASPEQFISAQPRLLPLRAGFLHAGRLHRAGGAARHRLPREEARAAVLRRQRASRSSTCWRGSAPRRASRCAPAARSGRFRDGAAPPSIPPRGRRGTLGRTLRCRHRPRRLRVRVAGRGVRRAFDPEDRRDGPGAAAGAAVRAARSSNRGRDWCR